MFVLGGLVGAGEGVLGLLLGEGFEDGPVLLGFSVAMMTLLPRVTCKMVAAPAYVASYHVPALVIPAARKSK